MIDGAEMFEVVHIQNVDFGGYIRRREGQDALLLVEDHVLDGNVCLYSASGKLKILKLF